METDNKSIIFIPLFFILIILFPLVLGVVKSFISLLVPMIITRIGALFGAVLGLAYFLSYSVKKIHFNQPFMLFIFSIIPSSILLYSAWSSELSLLAFRKLVFISPNSLLQAINQLQQTGVWKYSFSFSSPINVTPQYANFLAIWIGEAIAYLFLPGLLAISLLLMKPFCHHCKKWQPIKIEIKEKAIPENKSIIVYNGPAFSDQKEIAK